VLSLIKIFKTMPYSDYWEDRGFPWEHDPGPPKNLSWIRLFSESPNYRGLGNALSGKERYRWHFGPMYYRGRLGPKQVKVLVIGQEGAQDESLAHRSFVGSSGARMQHFLQFIGIGYHYLFLNTFVYPIFGQYGDNDLRWLAQSPHSPIARQRGEIFSYVLKKNDVRLVVAVGRAAKESVQTWLESRGGSCPDGTDDLSTATGDFLDAKTKIVGVVHPGGAKDADQKENIIASFQAAVDKIRDWAAQDTGWLPAEPGRTRNLDLPFEFNKAPIPFRDLPLGTSWRLGRGSTTSNRMDEERSIQIFAAGGQYNQFTGIQYSGLSNGSNEGYSQLETDYPYEPPVNQYKEYDKGPLVGFLKILQGAYASKRWPDFTTLGATSEASLGYQAAYRGRPNQARFLILADQQSQDDLFTMRALTGNGGQHIQSFLKAAGIESNYCFLRLLPVDTLDLSFNQQKTIMEHPEVIKVYQSLVDKVIRYKKTKVIITFGRMSQHLLELLNLPAAVPVVTCKSWSQSGAKQDWKDKLEELKSKSYEKEITANFEYDGEREQIPRKDLPFGVLRWQGSSGDRAQRARLENGDWSPHYYKWFLPDWVYNLPPEPLSASEQKAVDKFSTE
jgi:uracil-DNA glycosylase